MDFTESPGVLIHRLAHALAREMDRRLKNHDVTISQWAILRLLWLKEGRSQVELQEHLGLDGATVTGLLQRMTLAGLIQRKPDLTDKRVQRVFLTERGRELEKGGNAVERELHSQLFAGFTDDEKTFFMRLLIRALHNCTEI